MKLFNIKRGSWTYQHKILSDKTLVMLERPVYLATILLLECSIDFIISDLMVGTMLNYGQYTKVNQQQVNINVNVRCFTIIVVQENI